MNSRDRILSTLVRRSIERPPVDLWLTDEALDSLLKYTDQVDELVLYRELGVDKIVWAFPDYEGVSGTASATESRDPWGVPTVRTQSGLATYQEFGPGPLGAFERIEQLGDYP